MKRDNLLAKVKEAGFQNIEGFIKANLHYLPEDKQRLFNSVVGVEKECYRDKDSKKSYYQAFKLYSRKGYKKY